MRNRFTHIVLTLLCATLLLTGFSACDTTVKTDMAVIGDAVETKYVTEASAFYKIDTSESELNWIGAKITGRHNGILHIKEGQLELNNATVTGGRIIFDMAAISSNDKTLDSPSNEKLTTHLRSADFLNTERYPTAEFEITGIEPYDSTRQTTDPNRKYSELRVNNPTHRLRGNLTIKGQKKSVTFPVKITMAKGEMKARANFNIDRTRWGLVYRADKSLGNQTIYPEVNIDLNILAKPASANQAL